MKRVKGKRDWCDHQRVKLEPVVLEDGAKACWRCLTCILKERACVRYAIILCMRRCLPGVKDLHRLIAGKTYFPFPWIVCESWGWMHFPEITDMYVSDDDGQEEEEDDDDETTSLVIRFIDRGVDNFMLFAATLKQQCPRLRRLQWHQNYSHMQTVWHLLAFITEMNLERLWISDRQSEMFDADCWNYYLPALLGAMPRGAKYTIEACPPDDVTDKELILHEGSKTLTVHFLVEE
jgi:hypothetical protein